MMDIRGWWAAAGFLVAATGCTSILGDFTLQASDGSASDTPTDSPTAPDTASEADAGLEARGPGPGSDARIEDAGSSFDATSADGSFADATTPMADGGSSADGACAAGLTRCAGGCTALDAATACGSCANDCTAALAGGHVVSSSIGCSSGRCTFACAPGFGDCVDAGATACATDLTSTAANCGACGHGCKLGRCSASSCGPYVVAQQPTTGSVAKLATDGARVFWSDTGIVAIEQIPATGGNAIALASASVTNGAVSSELSVAGSTVAFSYLGVATPSLGLATVDYAGSGTSVVSGALSVGAVSLNASATHVFYVDITGTQGSLNDCRVNGREAGACAGVAGGGRFLAQTAADGAHMLFDMTGSGTSQQAGLYVDDIATNTANIFSPAVAQSLAVDGSWAYWSEQNDGGTSYTLYRTLEAAPGTVVQTLASNLASSAFATDAANVYYWTGSAVVSKPVAGGAETSLAPASSFVQIATGGGLLVWTDGATISGVVLPAH